MDKSNIPVLVTGATGLVGSCLLQHLWQKGYRKLHATRRANSSLALIGEELANQIQWHEADLLDMDSLEEALDGIQQVYHAAALVSFDSRDASKLRQVNGEGTANLVNLSLDMGVSAFLHLSSVAALGRNIDRSEPIGEKAIWESSKLNSAYAISKHLSEMEVWRGVAEGLNACVVNPSVILGAGFWNQGSSQLVQRIAEGFPFVPQGGTGFVDVRDVAEASVALLEGQHFGQRFVLNGFNSSYRALFYQLADALEVRRPYIEVGPLLRELAWRLAWLQSRLSGKPAFITRETARNAAHTWEYNNRKVLEALPEFQFRRAEETVRYVCDAYKSSLR
jgi:dihydroflavonol-4-reductase